MTKIINGKIEEGEQKGRKMWFAFIKAKELVGKDNVLKVDVYDKDKNKEGYQRELVPARADAFKKFIAYENKFSPTSILLNIRHMEKVKIETNRIVLDDKEYLWIVDGQHRIAGLKKLLEEDPANQEYATLEVPIIITNLSNKFEEAILFAVFNKTQTGVKYDLVESVLAEQIKKGNIDVQTLVNEYDKAGTKILREISARIKAVDIANELNDTEGSPWHDNIIAPNEKQLPSHKKIIRQRSFTTSLEPLIKYFEKYAINADAKLLVEHLTVFWNALERVMPQAFKSPEDYVLQKGTGVAVLHEVYPKLLLVAVDNNTAVPNIDKLTEGLNNIKTNLSSDSDNFLMPDYWDRKNGTAGTAGTSKKSFAQLVSKITASLDQYMQSKNEVKK